MSHTMPTTRLQLFLLERPLHLQATNDQFVSLIVAAVDQEAARYVHPDIRLSRDAWDGRAGPGDLWIDARDVIVLRIGETTSDLYSNKMIVHTSRLITEGEPT